MKKNAASAPTKTEYQVAKEKYASGRANLLLMIVFTVINIVLLLVNADVMFIFSATVPYYAVVFGYAFEIPTLVAIGIVFAAIILAVYLACWFFSKKHYGWMIAAVVLFAIDTVFMALLFVLFSELSGIIDALGHIWVMYYLIIGVVSGAKLKKLAPEEELKEVIEAQYIEHTSDDSVAAPVASSINGVPVSESEKQN